MLRLELNYETETASTHLSVKIVFLFWVPYVAQLCVTKLVNYFFVPISWSDSGKKQQLSELGFVPTCFYHRANSKQLSKFWRGWSPVRRLSYDVISWRKLLSWNEFTWELYDAKRSCQTCIYWWKMRILHKKHCSMCNKTAYFKVNY